MVVWESINWNNSNYHQVELNESLTIKKPDIRSVNTQFLKISRNSDSYSPSIGTL